jgi:hypothetical protein
MLRLSRGLLIKAWGAFLLTGIPAGIAHGASFGAGLGAAPPPLTDYVCPGDCNRDRTVMVNEVAGAGLPPGRTVIGSRSAGAA